jgi:hypothetical protein
MKIIDNNTVKLCCNGQNCPTVEKVEHTGKYKITDDFGGVVFLTKEEFDELEDANKHFKTANLKVAENKFIKPGELLING